ncbi:hydroxyacid dehydrogenase [Halosolutus gelatinilyticus]|uniref:hydroxyacid dehydrogenase n=1 Tax=Halosolutus gelatinilyticus TaxID=2931975 RepID=UPI001FF22705|nr:hydroxyacid dehydrogenase [Halosolutus gelatinilyticus]
MNILVTLPAGPQRDVLFPSDVASRLESVGIVDWNDDDQLTSAELRERLRGVDVCVTGWGSPTLSADVLDGADSLELIGHVGGSVTSIASPAVYERGIPVVSANRAMAPFVAEGILAYMLTALRDTTGFDAAMKNGAWPGTCERTETLFGSSIGFVGLGDVGEELLSLLAPFDPTVRVYDPYASAEDIAAFEFATMAALDTVLESSDVVSIHASKTPETLHMLDAELLSMLPDGCLLVNAARGAIVDEDALVDELRTGRIRAALDVFEEEPLPESSPLRDLDDVVLGPHVAGAPTRYRLAETVIDEIERFDGGEPLENRVSRERYEHMTQDWLEAE